MPCCLIAKKVGGLPLAPPPELNPGFLGVAPQPESYLTEIHKNAAFSCLIFNHFHGVFTVYLD